MQLNSFIEFESSLFTLVILSRQVFFSTSIMALLHRHRQKSPFPLFFLVYSLPMSVTTCLDRCFHWQLFPEPSYFSPYIIRGTRCPLPFSMWWWTMSGRRSGCSSASTVWSGHSCAEREGQGRCHVDNWWGVGVAVDDEEAALNKKDRADVVDLASVPLLGSDITDEEGGIPKGEPACGRGRSSRGGNRRRRRRWRVKEKKQQPSRMRCPPSYPSPPCLWIRSRCNRWWGRRNMSRREICHPPPDLWGANNAAPKEKPMSSFFIVFPLVFAGTSKADGEASNTNPLLVLSPVPAFVPLWDFSLLP